MFTLYPHQEKLAADVTAAWSRVNSVAMILGTGGGKTVIFSKLVHDHNNGSAVIAHRKEIVVQIAMSLAEFGVKHRVIAPAKTVALIRRKQLFKYGKSFVDPHAPVGVASAQTLTSAATARDTAVQRWLKQCTLAVFDEGHHYVQSGVWARAVEALGRAKKLFVTATPERADGQGMGSWADGFCDEMVIGPATKWLMDNGYLSKYKYYAPESDFDVSDLKLTASGDFSARQLRDRTVESHLVGDVVKQYIQYGMGGKAIGFAPDVETAGLYAAAFNAAGIPSIALSGETEQGERDYQLGQFENGPLQVLWNVDLFDEGFDVPAASVVILARKTDSLGKFLQQIGRVLRTAEGKTHAVIIDPVRNWERHGMPDWPRAWTLDRREKKTRSGPGDTIPQRVCVSCTQPYEAFYTRCPYCAAVPPIPERRTPEQVDGDLTELDVDAMSALLADMQKANMSDEEFALDMARRGVPPIGRSKQLRSHVAAKYRRKVLRQITATWLACLPDEVSKAEAWKRFYFFFGTDIVQAFKLNASDTDALIDVVAANFERGIRA